MNEIMLYTAKSCPHCPATKTLLEQFCAKHPDFTLRIVDVDSISKIDILVAGIFGTPAATVNGHVLFLSHMAPTSIEEVERETGLKESP